MKSNITNASSPQSLIGLATIMRLAFNGNNLAELTAELIARIQNNAADAAALLDLAIVLQLNEQPELALEMQWQALQLQQHFSLHSNPKAASLRLLAILGPGAVMANTPVEFLVEDANIALDLLYLGQGLPAPAQLPAHDVAFVAVCESDENQSLLAQLSEIMHCWPLPFINSPGRIAQLSRQTVSRKLAGGNGFLASEAQRIVSIDLPQLANSLGFPIIARPVNSHAGQGLSKLNSKLELQPYLELQPSAEYFIAPFIDYRSPDGWYRKYRVTMIDGSPYAAHMAISQNWMVHYLNADMLQNEKNRAEEHDFMRTFDSNFAVKHQLALREIDRRIGLDYYSIDCAETSDGRLLVFELDSGAVVHAMDSADIFPYKPPQMKRVFAAFQQMLGRRVNQTPSSRAG